MVLVLLHYVVAWIWNMYLDLELDWALVFPSDIKLYRLNSQLKRLSPGPAKTSD